ncbi:MAG TPA: nucleotidyltransferase family protein [Oscillospiraceae bacterium]|jgi:predicted nucleotidyltransferase|nr:nucleotidyltransferase family protein [Oscillospiraceae bacterium]
MNTGIICEFNPFHSGHKHLIDSVKNDGAVICVMSGNYVQRGEFAIYDKFKRCAAALENGADLVIELPCVYSLMSAEGFAKAGVTLLESTKITDRIAFGAECDNIDLLKSIAQKVNESQDLIKEEMKKGISYPSARKNVIKSGLLDTPNNILAIEYIRQTKLPVKAIKRIGKGHDTDDELYSASAIRQTLKNDDICSLYNCEKAVLAKLRSMSIEDFAEIEDVTEGLENRIFNSVRKSTGIDEIYEHIKTKRYTLSRIRRIIIKSYLGITKEYSKDVPYIRILGFNDKGKDLLSKMKKNADLPIISKYSDIKKLDDFGKKLFELECRCTDLYNLGYKNPLPCGTEQRSQIIIKNQ